MAKIVLHAGMGKTGSTSLQKWLGTSGKALYAEVGVTTLTATVDAAAQVRVARHATGTINSSTIMGYCWEHPDDRERVLDGFFARLDEEARRHGSVVLSGEAFCRPIALGDEDLLQRLDELASGHELSIAYYVRPQHLALESGWKDWRSQREKVPAEFISRMNRQLHHFNTVTFVHAVAPRVLFQLRPCRPDLLHERNVVSDFARVFLGIETIREAVRYWENAGVPLEVANVLTFLPTTPRWPPEQDHLVLEMVKGMIAGTDLPRTPRAQLSHLVLQQACHDYFEGENRKLIDTLGWEITEWVPAVDADIGEASFERMNALWQPSASAAELAFLQHALAELFTTQRELTALRTRRSVRAALRVSRLFRAGRVNGRSAERRATPRPSA